MKDVRGIQYAGLLYADIGSSSIRFGKKEKGKKRKVVITPEL